MTKVCVVVICVLVAAIPDVFSVKLSLNFDPCPLNVTGNNHCAAAALENALRNFPHGSKAIGVLPLDPLEVTEMLIEFDNNFANGTYIFKNMSVNGISNSRITDFERVEKEGYSFKFVSETPLMSYAGPYSVNLTALNLQVNSRGACLHELYHLQTVHRLSGELYKKRKGKSYFRCTEYKTEMNVKKFVPYVSNLFNGDVELEKFYSNFMRENADVLFNVGKSYMAEGLNVVYRETLNNFLKRIPIDKLFIVD